jgi:hypothetical protein
VLYLLLGAAERPAPDLEGEAEREGWEGLLCLYWGLLCVYPCERCWPWLLELYSLFSWLLFCCPVEGRACCPVEGRASLVLGCWPVDGLVSLVLGC